MIHRIGEVKNYLLFFFLIKYIYFYLVAIWINMNYMVLSALQYYAKTSGPYSDKSRQIYGQLRTNLITNMFRVYEKTGHIWEQYDDKTGHGQGSHPFTGWSSLIVLIMSELYDE
jgi:mannosyl-oligosaccharide glucosidase